MISSKGSDVGVTAIRSEVSRRGGVRNLAAKRVKDRFGRFKLAAKGGEVVD